MSAETVRAHAIVRGRVQMVGFRAFVQRYAAQLGLCGTVRNRPDGSVESVVEGPRDAVEQMIRLLERGPSHAQVDSVDVDYGAPAGNLPRMSVTA